MRADKLLHLRGLARSREAAQQMIRGGAVLADGKAVTKPSLEISEDACLQIVGEVLPFVSRGGLKLERALDAFNLDVSGLDCVDIGASTGGFTDCLLKNGAASVRALDVGRAQLDKSLEADPRVKSFEGINARYVLPQDIGGKCELAVCDVSFISLTLILGAVRGLVEDGGRFVCLIKPQFEAGRGNIGKGGIVRDRNVHTNVIKKIFTAAEDVGFYPAALCASPIPGGDGNREYLALFESKDKVDVPTDAEIKRIVFDS